MLEKHLGKRFGLFDKEALNCTTITDLGGEEHWSIREIEAVWKIRHEIVHEGRLDLTRGNFETALFVCSWVEAFLGICAQRVFGLVVDSESTLRMYADLFEKPQRYTLFVLQTTAAFAGFLSTAKVKR